MFLLRHMFIGQLLFVVAILVGTAPVGGMKQAHAAVQEIAAVVNDDAVSMHDVQKRMRLVMGSSGLPNNADIRSKLMPQILGGLINEKVMIQEAMRLGIEVSEEEIQNGFAKVAAQNKMEPKQFKEVLRRNNVDVQTLYDQIRAQISWSNVVQKKLRSRVIISERDIDDALARLKSKIGSTEYLAAEIYLPVEERKQENDARNLAQRLVQEMRAGKASFFQLAQQFSRAAGAAQGGDIGWVQEDQLEPSVRDALAKIDKNQVTSPVKTSDGYHIYFLRDERSISEETLPSRQQIEYTIGTERLEKLQQHHLMDLRAAAFVDIRG